jgi:Rieske 2Fe-2S family protein
MNMSELINNYQSGYSLEQGSYNNDDIYQKEIENIFLENWILAGMSRKFLSMVISSYLNFDKESVIITRTQTGEINALLNVCRHRGAHICLQNKGNTKALICRKAPLKTLSRLVSSLR